MMEQLGTSNPNRFKYSKNILLGGAGTQTLSALAFGGVQIFYSETQMQQKNGLGAGSPLTVTITAS
jgi:hypothetical protein